MPRALRPAARAHRGPGAEIARGAGNRGTTGGERIGGAPGESMPPVPARRGGPPKSGGRPAAVGHGADSAVSSDFCSWPGSSASWRSPRAWSAGSSMHQVHSDTWSGSHHSLSCWPLWLGSPGRPGRSAARGRSSTPSSSRRPASRPATMRRGSTRSGGYPRRWARWPAGSIRWPPGSRRTRRNAGRSSPTSPTSSGRRSPLSRAASRRSWTGSTRPMRPTCRRSWRRPTSSTG